MVLIFIGYFYSKKMGIDSANTEVVIFAANEGTVDPRLSALHLYERSDYPNSCFSHYVIKKYVISRVV